ncbi:SEFIR domain-containing protein [Fusibacter sp. 3D3]|uniref:SEFIR domain-containing protein n=1 Tax=Fusibacter sp. 3D3 TaxID=1048380 RepID=UPI00085394A6|nr:SEFIR domain-containing protein [Fusibacter sp. 3D3]GAU78498.1 conserved domain protein [Fusibacter sp. 3D3]
MSKVKIENPKIFISYAWGTEDYQNKVLSLATELSNDGVDVQLDKWSLKEGNDTYAFMEQCVADTSITNVLILLDKQYSIKANSRSGGVGTETQIISPEIYNKTQQDKFIPVIFERDENNEIHKPTYLKGLLHFDLSLSEQYDNEYQRLVKRLYGVEIFQKPDIGKKPSWVETQVTVSTKTRNAHSILKTNITSRVKNEQFAMFLSNIKDEIVSYTYKNDLPRLTSEDHLLAYEGIKSVRDEFLELMRYISFVDNAEHYVSSMLEETINTVKKDNGILKNIKLTLIHEMFLYIIAIFYKKQNFEGISYILGKTYFADDYSIKADNFNIFYFHNEQLDEAVNKRDDKKYYSGTAQYWIENINIEVCSKNEFTVADLLCYNYSIFGADYHYNWFWFPITYIYSGNDMSLLRTLATKMKSLEHFTKTTKIFGYNTVQDFKQKIVEIEAKIEKGELNKYRYSDSFDNAPLLCDYIKTIELGTLK